MIRARPHATWHPVPNRLTDEVLPGLRDTELRVLLVVLRQTWGWRDAPGGMARKRRDWLSHGQLCRRTGRGSAAVSGAVGALVRVGLLAVEDAAGTALATPAARRRHLGRLYYAPGAALADGDETRPVENPGQPVENLGAGGDNSKPVPSAKSENDKRNT